MHAPFGLRIDVHPTADETSNHPLSLSQDSSYYLLPLCSPASISSSRRDSSTHTSQTSSLSSNTSFESFGPITPTRPSFEEPIAFEHPFAETCNPAKDFGIWLDELAVRSIEQGFDGEQPFPHLTAPTPTLPTHLSWDNAGSSNAGRIPVTPGLDVHTNSPFLQYRTSACPTQPHVANSMVQSFYNVPSYVASDGDNSWVHIKESTPFSQTIDPQDAFPPPTNPSFASPEESESTEWSKKLRELQRASPWRPKHEDGPWSNESARTTVSPVLSQSDHTCKQEVSKYELPQRSPKRAFGVSPSRIAKNSSKHKGSRKPPGPISDVSLGNALVEVIDLTNNISTAALAKKAHEKDEPDTDSPNHCQLLLANGEKCNRRFERKEHLTRHLRTKMHGTKGEDLTCPVPQCTRTKIGETFGRNDNLRDHIIKRHFEPAQSGRGRNPRIDDLEPLEKAKIPEWIILAWDEWKVTHDAHVLRSEHTSLPNRDKSVNGRAQSRRRRGKGLELSML